MTNGFTINPDGTITRNGSTSSSGGGSNNNGGPSKNTSWIWIVFIEIGIIVGIIIALNSEDSDSYTDPTQKVYETEEVAYEEESNKATYLRVSNNDITFDANGGTADIDVYTDGNWNIGINTASWGHISKYNSSITLRVDSYSGRENRTDYFTIIAGDYEKRIEITQHGNHTATYLTVSKSNVTFDSDGGYVDIEISTDGEWDIGTQPYDWGHISKYSSSIRLRVDSYSGTEDRTDYFTITAGDYERRISIKQYANNEPSATIDRVWVDHNEYYNGYKGMLIHVEISVENLEGETVYVYAYFYQGDNITPLHDPYGNELYFYGTGNVTHKFGSFEDFRIFVPYMGLNMAPGSGDLSFDISVKHKGEQLDRENNNQFTFTSGY
jgi:hypothetical protein